MVTLSQVILTVYALIWASIHSLLASHAAKGWAKRTFGENTRRWYRLAFNLFAGASLLPLLLLFAALPDTVLYTIPSSWRWLSYAGQGISLFALLWTVLQTSPMHFAGLAQLLDREPADDGPLQLKGLYAYVRHPLYLFSIVLLWLMPVMTANRTAINVLASLYFVVGSVFEERKLLQQHGEAYAHYQRHVPRLVPRLRKYSPPRDMRQTQVPETKAGDVIPPHSFV
jgi:protein-S-isoprenylcysteine O-methyltransferase Ste14